MHGALDAFVHSDHAGDRRSEALALRHRRCPAGDRAARERDGNRAARLPPVSQEVVAMQQPAKKIEVSNLRLSYGAREVIHGITFDIRENEIFGVIGPAQSAKTSLLRCVNRTIEFSPDAKLK